MKRLGDLTMDEVLQRTIEADKLLNVKFYTKKVYSEYETKLQGKEVYIDQECLTIRVPGSKDIMDRKATKEDKKRFALLYEAFQLGVQNNGEGTPISTMPGFDDEHIKVCEKIGLFTVEQLAMANEKMTDLLGADGQVMKRMASKYQEVNEGKVQDPYRKVKNEPIKRSTKSRKKNKATR